MKTLYKKKEVEDKIDTAAVTVADAIRELEFKLGGKSKYLSLIIYLKK